MHLAPYNKKLSSQSLPKWSICLGHLTGNANPKRKSYFLAELSIIKNLGQKLNKDNSWYHISNRWVILATSSLEASTCRLRTGEKAAAWERSSPQDLERKTKWSEVAQSCPTLCDPMDSSLPGSFVHGIFQARILEWVAISFSRRSSRPRDWTWVSLIVGRHFTIWATREVRKGRQVKKKKGNSKKRQSVRED